MKMGIDLRKVSTSNDWRFSISQGSKPLLTTPVFGGRLVIYKYMNKKSLIAFHFGAFLSTQRQQKFGNHRFEIRHIFSAAAKKNRVFFFFSINFIFQTTLFPLGVKKKYKTNQRSRL